MDLWHLLPLDRSPLAEALVRAAIRHLNRQRLRRELRGTPAERQERFRALLHQLRTGPITVEADRANQQHYEVPSEFFEALLGPHLKYSCAWWGPEVGNLAEAEEAMLDLYVRRARLEDGQRVLDLGCGWGSLTRYLARRFPRMRITAFSNSRTQREFLLERLQGHPGVDVQTGDVARLDLPEGEFDRILSVEMLEHVRNHQAVLGRLHRALKPGGLLFVHVFCHREATYLFEGGGWMERHFFSGGIMPGRDLLLHQAGPLAMVDHWLVDGRHYQKTLEAWLRKMRENPREVQAALERAYGPRQWRRFRVLWQIFLMACAELFGHARGTEWMVAHYLMAREGD